MAIVQRPRKDGKITYWVTFSLRGADGELDTKWERAGTDKRKAQALEKQRKDEVKTGTYHPELTGQVTVETWIDEYFRKVKYRSADDDADRIRLHVTPRKWFSQMLIQDVRGKHCLRLVEDLKEDSGLAGKSIATTYGVVCQAFRRAVFEDVIGDDPTKLPKGTVKWKSNKKRQPYTRDEAQRLISDPRIPIDARVFLALAFYTGMREGEICGRKWSDWDLDPEPLTCLAVDSQYEDQPLKTDDEEDVHPRRVPVHPDLYAILIKWRATGFREVYCRDPLPTDRIVPHRKLGTHTKSSAYKMFRRALLACGGTNRTLHSTRHTFISIARSNNPNIKDVLERVTHNSRGDQVDQYTHFEWLPLCEAVASFDLSLDPSRNEAFLQWRRRELKIGLFYSKKPLNFAISACFRTPRPEFHSAVVHNSRPVSPRISPRRGDIVETRPRSRLVLPA